MRTLAAAFAVFALAGPVHAAPGIFDETEHITRTLPLEPGGTAAMTLKPAVKGLKPAHPKGEPKKPSRWEWVELPIPKIAAPGARRIRFLTDQRGFAIAAVVVSATRSKPPSEPEAAELAKARALDATPAWALDRPGSSPRVLIDDFESGKSGFAYIGGWEFPGATGSYAIDSTTGHDSKASAKFTADFTGGGAYIGGWRDLANVSNRNFKEIRFWVKAPTLTGIGIRLADATGQTHQRNIPVTPSAEWQEVILKPVQFAGEIVVQHPQRPVGDDLCGV